MEQQFTDFDEKNNDNLSEQGKGIGWKTGLFGWACWKTSNSPDKGE